jgi:hypothetical protein
LGKETVAEGRYIHEEHIRGKAVGGSLSTRDYVIVPMLHQKLVEGLSHQMVAEVDPDMHALLPFRNGRCALKGYRSKYARVKNRREGVRVIGGPLP